MHGRMNSWRAGSLVSVGILAIVTACGSSSCGGGGSSGAAGGGAAGSGGAAGGSVAGSPGTAGTAGAQAQGGTPPTDAPRACGSQTCALDEWCTFPCCGNLPPCMPDPDGGTCPVGYASCSTIANVMGCQYTCTIPSCSKNPPPPGCMIIGRQVRCTCA